MNDRPTEFIKRLFEWQADAGLTQRQLAALIGVTEGRLSQLRNDPKDRPGEGLMRSAIAKAPEPWKSALKQARQADQDAADAAAAMAVA